MGTWCLNKAQRYVTQGSQPSNCNSHAPKNNVMVPFTVKKITPAQPNLRKYDFQFFFSMFSVGFFPFGRNLALDSKAQGHICDTKQRNDHNRLVVFFQI